MVNKKQEMISYSKQPLPALKYILLLLKLCSTICVFSQGTLREFIVEKDNNPQVPQVIIYRGCTPDDGVIVFYTTIPDLKFSMPDTPSRLKNVSPFDRENNCYVLCVQPTDTRIGGIMQYSIDITGNTFKPMIAFMVSGITPSVAQYFKINPTNQQEREEDNEKGGVFSAMTWSQEGAKNSKEGNFSEAIRCYSNALDINPNMSDAWYNLGIAYGREKQKSEALECYQKAAQLGNKDAQKLLTLMGKRW